MKKKLKEISLMSIAEALRIEQVTNILKHYNLNPDHVLFIQDTEINPSAEAPYHNAHHLMSVAIAADRLGRYYLSNPQDPQLKLLVLAALYHDLNHSLGEYGDSINVSRAVADTIELLKLAEPELTNNELTAIGELILTTEYPYTGPAKNILHKIIRDSDLLQWTQPDVDRWLEGLTEETGHSITLESTKVFLNTSGIHTKRAIAELHTAGLITRNW